MNHTTNSLGLQELFAAIISETDNSITFPAYLAPSSQICPCCDKITSRIHGYKLQKIKDLPARLKNVIILLRKRRYICSCGKTFFQANSFLPNYYRAKNRFYSSILCCIYSSRSFKDIAANFNVFVNTVSKMSQMISIPNPKELPEVLGIDEFKENTNGEKYY